MIIYIVGHSLVWLDTFHHYFERTSGVLIVFPLQHPLFHHYIISMRVLLAFNKDQDWAMLLNCIELGPLFNVAYTGSWQRDKNNVKTPRLHCLQTTKRVNIRRPDVFTNGCKGSSTPWCGLSLLSACLHLLPHQHLQVGGQHQQPALLLRRPTPPAEHPWRLPPRLPWYGHQHVGSET